MRDIGRTKRYFALRLGRDGRACRNAAATACFWGCPDFTISWIFREITVGLWPDWSGMETSYLRLAGLADGLSARIGNGRPAAEDAWGRAGRAWLLGGGGLALRDLDIRNTSGLKRGR